VTTTFDVWLSALPALLVLAVLGWLISLAIRNVIVASVLWAVMMVVACVSYALDSDPRAPGLASIPPLMMIWAVRHIVYLVVRRRQMDPLPGFAFQRLFLVFVPQAFLAWIVSLPLLGAMTSIHVDRVLFQIGLAVLGIGVLFEGIAGWLSRFRPDPAKSGATMDRVLAFLARHPNYLGEALIWWGIWLFACAAGAWWAFPGPLLLTALALRAAQPRQENDSGKGRPGYADYVLKTNAFFPAGRRN
jgi:steroid 5-alpha reductase family enzyme